MSYITKVLSNVGLKHAKRDSKATCAQLLQSCKDGDIASVKECLSMIRKDFNVNWEDVASGFTPLKYAVYYGHYDIVMVLLEQKKINPNYRGGKYCTLPYFGDFAAPIYLAVTEAHRDPLKYLKILQMLYKNDADINIETRQNADTPLLASIRIECLPVFKYLISKPDIRVDKMNGNNWNALHVAAFYNSQQTEMMQMLLKHGVRLSDVTSDGSTALHLCARSWPMIGSNEIQRGKMMLLIKYGVDVDVRNVFKKTAFDYLNAEYKAFFIQFAQKYGGNASGMNDEDEKEIMKILYPTPQSNHVQLKLLKENEELKSEVAKLQEKFDLLLNQNATEEDGVNEEEEVSKKDELWQSEEEYVQFVEWLTEKVKLKQYLKNFEEEGWCDVRLIADLDKDELLRLGITKRGHQRIILKEVEEYKQRQEHDVEGAPTTNDVK